MTLFPVCLRGQDLYTVRNERVFVYVNFGGLTHVDVNIFETTSEFRRHGYYFVHVPNCVANEDKISFSQVLETISLLRKKFQTVYSIQRTYLID